MLVVESSLASEVRGRAPESLSDVGESSSWFSSRLTVIIPAYNEELTISETIHDLMRALSLACTDWELIIVDDGSSDATYWRAQGILEDPRVTVVRTRHMGKGHAVRAGILLSTGEIVATIDADSPVPVDALVKCVWKIVDGSGDFCIGRRILDADLGGSPCRTRVLASSVVRALARLIEPGLTSDPNCCVKAFSRPACQILLSRCRENGYGFDLESQLTLLEGDLRLIEIPVSWRDQRLPGVSRALLGGFFDCSILMARVAIRRVLNGVDLGRSRVTFR